MKLFRNDRRNCSP